jgi:hypothetical protein
MHRATSQNDLGVVQDIKFIEELYRSDHNSALVRAHARCLRGSECHRSGDMPGAARQYVKALNIVASAEERACVERAPHGTTNADATVGSLLDGVHERATDALTCFAVTNLPRSAGMYTVSQSRAEQSRAEHHRVASPTYRWEG